MQESVEIRVSLQEFADRCSEVLAENKASHHPILLTVGDHPEWVIQDSDSYQALLDRVDRAETVAGIREGLEDMEKDQGISLKDFDRSLRAKYGFPHRSK